MKTMVLAVDIGNTNIGFGLIGTDGIISQRCVIPTSSVLARSLSLNMIRPWMKKRIEKIIIVSVVPEALRKLKPYFKSAFKGARILVVGNNINVPIKSEYNKTQIGQDRLITAFAAKLLYGIPILIIDFGTAVTFDCVSRKGVYLGGLILPGIKMSLDSLSERTAMLPKTYLKKTSSFIGRDTISSIRSGMIYGYGSICDGLIDHFKKRIGHDIKIIATGGDAFLIRRYTSKVKMTDEDLALKGLYLLFLFSER